MNFSTFSNFNLPASWQKQLATTVDDKFNHNGNYARWQEFYNNLPELKTEYINLTQPTIEIGQPAELTSKQHASLLHNLKGLCPWRKGPFGLFGIMIDAEWRSDFKWQRLSKHISPLAGKRVLDVGCGNGYFMWRMVGDRAAQVVGIDPNILFIMQFMSLRKYIENPPNIMILPQTLSEIPLQLQIFDTTFSMGVLYHRSCAFNHLSALKGTLKSGGQLVLETLVVAGEEGYSLLPKSRYAKMKNVYQLPTVATLRSWLERVGFVNIALVDVSVTDTTEQRKTAWMNYESLADFLNPHDHSQTIEGYPAPMRAVFIANK